MNPSRPSSDPLPLSRAAVPGLVQDLLASLLSLKGRTAEAAAQRCAALEKLEQVLGPDHPELQPSLEQLAREFLSLQDFPAAATVLQRTYQYRVSHLEPEHPETLEHLALLTECLVSAGRPASAGTLLEHQIAVSERLRGPDHVDTLDAVLLLAKVRLQLGGRAAASALFRRAHEGFERTLGPTDPKSLASLYTLFEHLAEDPEPAAADPWGEKLLTRSQQVHGPADPLTIAAAGIVAHHYTKRKNFVAAVALLRRALAAVPGDESELSLPQARLQHLLAASLDLAAETAEAHRRARSAAYALHRHLGPDHDETARAYKHLTDIDLRRGLQNPWGRFFFRWLYRFLQIFRRGH